MLCCVRSLSVRAELTDVLLLLAAFLLCLSCSLSPLLFSFTLSPLRGDTQRQRNIQTAHIIYRLSYIATTPKHTHMLLLSREPKFFKIFSIFLRDVQNVHCMEPPFAYIRQSALPAYPCDGPPNETGLLEDASCIACMYRRMQPILMRISCANVRSVHRGYEGVL